MNSIKLHNPNGAEEYIKFTFEKSILDFHCNVSVEIQLDNEILNTEKWSVHFNEIIKIANWYKSMSGNSLNEMDDLTILELNLKFTNYYFEKGEGVYYLSYTSESGKFFKFQFWEQLGGSNIFIYNEFMRCLADINL